MPGKSSDGLRIERMVLGWLTPARWNPMSVDNKIKILLKVYEKSMPTKIAGDPENPIRHVVNLENFSESELVHYIRTRIPEIVSRESALSCQAN